MDNLKKRAGGAARNRQKQKKLLMESASSCKLIKDMFTNIKHTHSNSEIDTSKNENEEPMIEPSKNKNEEPMIEPSKNKNEEILIDMSKNVNEEPLIIDISKNKNEEPVQPSLLKFPKSNNRAFNCKFYTMFDWLEYSISEDAIYCFPCRHFFIGSYQGQIIGNVPYVNVGVKCWINHNTLAALQTHSKSEKHLSSVEKWTNYLYIKNKTSNSLTNLLNTKKTKEIEENRKHISFLFKAALYLSRQGLAFRGHDETLTSTNKGNYIELLETFCDANSRERLSSRYGHYCSPEYQNDIIKIIASFTRQNILKKLNSFGIFSILVDESKDASKKEQLSFIIRFIDNDFNIHEKALGCLHMKSSNAESLCQEITKVITENKLDINMCVAQCYDGASVMSGVYSGVQQRVSELVPHAIYVHCYAHRLNLCLIHTIQNIQELVNFFDTIQNVYKFLMNSQTRYELFVEGQKQKKYAVLHLERLVDTRWAYWYNSLQKVNSRYDVILDVLKVLIVQGNESAKASGLLKEMSSFRFIIILQIMEDILMSVHSLSCELQSPSLILPVAMELVNSTRNTLMDMRSGIKFKEFHEKAVLVVQKNKIKMNEDTLENIKRSQSYNKQLNDYYMESTIGKNGLKQKKVECVKVEILFQVIDRFVLMLDNRFSDKNQKLFNIFHIFNPLSLEYFDPTSSSLEYFLTHYTYFNINKAKIPSEFQSAKSLLKQSDHINFETIIITLSKLPSAFSETLKILLIIFTLPNTTASNERLFSSLKRVKSFLRLTMGDDRLNDLMVINIESDTARNLDIDEAVNKFASMKMRRYPLKY